MKSASPRRPSYLNFDVASYAWLKDVDYRKLPGEYKVGKGEQGVLICEPYKSEIGAFWRFKTPAIARESAEKIFALFNAYLEQEDFVGADMARKYLQMGFTRARRYANYKGGKKYDKTLDYKLNERGTGEFSKAESAEIFFNYWKRAEDDLVYSFVKIGWKMLFG